MTHNDRPSKKTDALEMRLSSEEKARLKQRAAEEGLTVSALIRSRLSDVLGDSPPPAATRDQGNVLMSGIWKRLVSRPALAGFAGAAALAALVIAAPPSVAQTVHLDVDAKIVSTAENGDRTAVASTSAVALEFGQPFDITLGAPNSTERLHIQLIARAVDANQAMVSSEITRLDGETRTMLGAPGALVRYGEAASIRVEAAGAPAVLLRVLVARPT